MGKHECCRSIHFLAPPRACPAISKESFVSDNRSSSKKMKHQELMPAETRRCSHSHMEDWRRITSSGPNHQKKRESAAQRRQRPREVATSIIVERTMLLPIRDPSRMTACFAILKKKNPSQPCESSRAMVEIQSLPRRSGRGE